ncbi:EAL domain-containing protein [Desulfovibrio sp.]|uniref:putative bifunctional diguanylate cyclase/phosphodiesterase n=1 Tax=Desulfovibrio sp. TaxID=885 RepID=UPI0025C5124E|nr:EAL domain-containing protein [Desulfovibrio sp.]
MRVDKSERSLTLPLLKQRIEQADDWGRAVEDCKEPILIVDDAGRITHFSEAFAVITDPLPQPPGVSAVRLWHPSYRSKAAIANIVDTLRREEMWRGAIYNRRRDGAPYWLTVTIWPIENAQMPTHYLLLVNSVSGHGSTHLLFDYLTHLPNWGPANDLLEKELLCDGVNKVVSLIQVRLEGLQEISDSLGHIAADSILIEAARRLYAAECAPAAISRISNQDFLLVIARDNLESATTAAAEQILKVMSAPFEVQDRDMSISVRLSVTSAPMDGTTSDQLFQNCSIAMSYGRKSKSAITFFTPEMQRRTAVRWELFTQLRTALSRNEFSLQYQPLISTSTGEMVGCEALLRWHNEALGQVPPDRFIRLAEENSLIVPIEAWALRTACRQAMAWLNEGRQIGRIAVNASPLHFQQGNIVDDVKYALRESGLPAQRLEIEITESSVMDDSPDVAAALEKLVELGVRLSLDDFGTGYSSLTYLRRYPFHTLKIDRSFVRDLPGKDSSCVLIKTIITMAKSLNLKVVAEGVETLQQAQFLRTEGCDIVQGYHYSRPLTVGQIEEVLPPQTTRTFRPYLVAGGGGE